MITLDRSKALTPSQPSQELPRAETHFASRMADKAPLECPDCLLSSPSPAAAQSPIAPPRGPSTSFGIAAQQQTGVSAVRDRAQYFEGLIRTRVAMSFQQEGANPSQSAIEMGEVSARTASPLSRISNISHRRGEEVLSELISEATRFIEARGESERGGDHLQAVEAISSRLADIAVTLSRKVRGGVGLGRG
jgi:hypothetical protein